jgi:hypothetical protein
MTQDQLELSGKDNTPLASCTDEQLRLKLAYYMWKDGADWPVVLELLGDKTTSREAIILILESTFDL